MEVAQEASTGQDIAVESGQQGNPGEVADGLDTTSEMDALESGQEEGNADETTEQETEEVTEERQGNKKTFEERMAEVRAQAAAEAEQRVIARLQEAAQANQQMQPNFAPPAEVFRTEREIADTLREVQGIETDLSLMSPEEYAANWQVANHALELRDRIARARDWVFQQKQLAAQFQQKLNAQQQQQQISAEKVRQIDRASDALRTELHIPVESWNAGVNFLKAELSVKPFLQQRFNELVDSGRVGEEVKMLYDYAEANIGKQAQADQQAKIEGKQKMVNQSGTLTVGGQDVKSWNDLMKLPSTEINKFARENPKQFQRIKDTHFK